MHQENRGFFGRLWQLWRGFWGTKLRSAEVNNAEAVYQAALSERMRQHQRLKEAVGRLVYLRNKVEGSVVRRREDLAIVVKALREAAMNDEDDKALALMRKKNQLEEELARLEGERERFQEQAVKAKEGLRELASALQSLRAERTEMLARRTHAMARLQVREALDGALDHDGIGQLDSSLSNVRESIVRLESEAGLSEDGEAIGDGVSMVSLRKRAAENADREALAALKREVNGRLLEEPKRRTYVSNLAVAPEQEGVTV